MNKFLRLIMSSSPTAEAVVRGNEKHSEFCVRVLFYAMNCGSLVMANASGLPESEPFIAIHIHNGKSCTGTSQDTFAYAGTHLNFKATPHNPVP